MTRLRLRLLEEVRGAHTRDVAANYKHPTNYLKRPHTPFELKYKFSCGILGTASEVGSGKRVIERKPLEDSLP